MDLRIWSALFLGLCGFLKRRRLFLRVDWFGFGHGRVVERRAGPADQALRGLSHRQDFQSPSDLPSEPGSYVYSLFFQYQFRYFLEVPAGSGTHFAPRIHCSRQNICRNLVLFVSLFSNFDFLFDLCRIWCLFECLFGFRAAISNNAISDDEIWYFGV